MAVGYMVSTKDREDIIILSDGRYRRFTENIEGDFTYARISSTGRIVDYAGFTLVSKYRIGGIADQSFPARRDYEYSK
jgi:hypothetical protein